MPGRISLAQIEAKRAKLIDWYVENRDEWPHRLQFQKDTPFEEFLRRLRFIESLKTREDPVRHEELESLLAQTAHYLKAAVVKTLDNDVLATYQKNIEIANLVAELDLDMSDNYGCTFITDSDDPVAETKRALEGHPRFAGEYSLERSLESDDAINHAYRRQERFGHYERAIILELRRYKEKDPLNIAHLIFHGTSAGVAGTASTLAECVQELKIPTHFGGSSKHVCAGIIYKP